MDRQANTAQSMTMATKHPPFPSVVLVVEQDQSLREAISSALRGEGYMVLAVADAELACDLVHDNRFALILLDSHGLQASGPVVSHRLRTSLAGAQTPLLLLTSQESEVSLIESNGLRADDYISKPPRWAERGWFLSHTLPRLLRVSGSC